MRFIFRKVKSKKPSSTSNNKLEGTSELNNKKKPNQQTTMTECHEYYVNCTIYNGVHMYVSMCLWCFPGVHFPLLFAWLRLPFAYKFNIHQCNVLL